MIVIPTLHCGGKCAEAIALYQKAFGLVVDWQGKDEKTNRIFHTEAHIGNQQIRFSDAVTGAVCHHFLSQIFTICHISILSCLVCFGQLVQLYFYKNPTRHIKGK